MRTREAAEQLGVSECELVAARCGGPDCVRLDGDWPALLHGLAALGPVQALTRNDHAVIERIGEYAPVVIDSDGARVAGTISMCAQSWPSGATPTRQSIRFAA